MNAANYHDLLGFVFFGKRLQEETSFAPAFWAQKQKILCKLDIWGDVVLEA